MGTAVPVGQGKGVPEAQAALPAVGGSLSRLRSPRCSQQKIELPVTENVQTIPPPYVVRTILVFGRPGCQPQFSMSEHMKVGTPLSPHVPPGWLRDADERPLASRPAEDAAVSLLLL